MAASPAAAATTLQFRLIVPCAAGNAPLTLARSGEALCVSSQVIADLSNVTSAAVGYVNGFEAIRVTLDDAAAARMASATAHDGVRMGIVFDGKLVSAPTVYGAISRDVEVDFGEQGVKLKQIAAALTAALKHK